MISQANKVFKAASVNIENGNVVHLENDDSIGILPPADEEDAYDGAVQELSRDEAADIISQAESDAKNMAANAINESKKILQEAQDQAQSLAEAIKQEAYDAGYREGLDSGKQEGETIIAEAQAVLQGAHDERAQILGSIEGDMLDLIIGITHKLIGDIADTNPQIITSLIKQGMAGATLSGNIVIHVSPEDYDEALANKEMLKSMTSPSVTIDINNDVSLQQYDCIIETPYGVIDSSLGQQFEGLRRDLYLILGQQE